MSLSDNRDFGRMSIETNIHFILSDISYMEEVEIEAGNQSKEQCREVTFTNERQIQRMEEQKHRN